MKERVRMGSRWMAYIRHPGARPDPGETRLWVSNHITLARCWNDEESNRDCETTQ